MKPTLSALIAGLCLGAPTFAHAGLLHISLPHGRHHHHHRSASAPAQVAEPPAAPPAPAPVQAAPQGW